MNTPPSAPSSNSADTQSRWIGWSIIGIGALILILGVLDAYQDGANWSSTASGGALMSAGALMLMSERRGAMYYLAVGITVILLLVTLAAAFLG